MSKQMIGATGTVLFLFAVVAYNAYALGHTRGYVQALEEQTFKLQCESRHGFVSVKDGTCVSVEVPR